MKNLKFLILLLLISFTQGNAQPKTVLGKNTKKILFLGNSITYQGTYISYLETYLRLKYPNNKYQFINVGLPSETVSGLSEPNHAKGAFPRPDLRERLKRIFKKTKPDFVFASYGINDGIYLPFDQNRFDKFKEGMQWLDSEIKKRKLPVVYMTPSAFDEKKDKAYAKVMDTYSDWIIAQKKDQNWKVIDLYWPMKKALLQKREKNPDFAFAKDGIHPNKLGHWLMAREILLYLGQPEVAKTENIRNAISNYKNEKNLLLQLVSEKQSFMKDAWLTATGHKRPKMKEGIPLRSALKEAYIFDEKIKILAKQAQ
ncbi:SGNH/GDSL hydrolase family protein [Flavicella sediminum]|uniref:SGNH/GDSL hydrolase family protein n=1 Tax=Flavicella sediminum TaxID=2585141 RepID=UPI00111CBF6C|nr:SGNH/GDSL hydrolase family protein [Flavicella sediminum]